LFDNWCERFGVDPCSGDDALARWQERIHPDDVQRFVAADKTAGVGPPTTTP